MAANAGRHRVPTYLWTLLALIVGVVLGGGAPAAQADEGVPGTIHIGIGTSHTLGGAVVAPTHYDLLMWEPTIEVDGRVVQRDKDILL